MPTVGPANDVRRVPATAFFDLEKRIGLIRNRLISVEDRWAAVEADMALALRWVSDRRSEALWDIVVPNTIRDIPVAELARRIREAQNMLGEDGIWGSNEVAWVCCPQQE